MKYIKQITDPKLVRHTIKSFYKELAYDNTVDLEDFDTENMVWLVLKEGLSEAGIIAFSYLNNVTWVPHIYIYEHFRGAESEQWGKMAADYMRRIYGAKKFLAITPHKAAVRYAERMGFKSISKLTKSVMKGGKLIDQYMLESE